MDEYFNPTFDTPVDDVEETLNSLLATSSGVPYDFSSSLLSGSSSCLLHQQLPPNGTHSSIPNPPSNAVHVDTSQTYVFNSTNTITTTSTTNILPIVNDTKRKRRRKDDIFHCFIIITYFFYFVLISFSSVFIFYLIFTICST